MPAHSFASLRRLRLAGDPFALRVTVTGDENPSGELVLYVVRSARRMQNNLALEYAIAKAFELPLVVCELPEEANARRAAFVRAGAVVNARDAEARGVRYLFSADCDEWIRRARIIVTDEHPLLENLAAAHHIDGNGILPMRAFAKEQYSAKFLRDRAHKLFPEMWAIPSALSSQLAARRSKGKVGLRADSCELQAGVGRVGLRAASCELRAGVSRTGLTADSCELRTGPGGRDEALRRLETFITEGLEGYANARNRSAKHLSGLSPYLRFGHIGIHEIAERVLDSDASDEDVDAFLEQAIIRRELSFNFCFYNRDYASLAALPEWARKTLDKHRGDRRKPSYSYEELERAATHDDVWNLAQTQLVERGTIHGYLRMLWGKKIIEWSETPEEAFDAMVRLHDVYALDGLDPNTYAGILWCFGKHDRPWAPERPIFGSIRWMSSEQTAKKVNLKELR